MIKLRLLLLLLFSLLPTQPKTLILQKLHHYFPISLATTMIPILNHWLQLNLHEFFPFQIHLVLKILHHACTNLFLVFYQDFIMKLLYVKQSFFIDFHLYISFYVPPEFFFTSLRQLVLQSKHSR
jgi:hypothetical protein